MNEKQCRDLFSELLNKKVYSFTILEGGLSNVSFAINDAYVMRVPSSYVQPFVNYRNEENILNVISSLKMSERIVYFDSKNGIKISKYIHGGFTYDETPSNEQIIMTAKAVKKLHRRKIKVKNYFSPLERLEHYRSYSLKEKLDQRYEKKIVRLMGSYLEKEELILCHNDLVRGNLLYKFDDVVVIDWEYAGMNSPYFDIASFISENNLDEHQKELFLQSYFGSKLNNLKRKKVNTFVNFNDILWYYWALMMHKNTENAFFLMIAEIKKQSVLEDMKRNK